MLKISNGNKVSRRTLLKGAAGLAAGSTLVTGFPAVYAAEEKFLRYLGTAVNQSDDITAKVKKDRGITIQNIVATIDDVTKRVATQPNSFVILVRHGVPTCNIAHAVVIRTAIALCASFFERRAVCCFDVTDGSFAFHPIAPLIWAHIGFGSGQNS